MWRGEVDDIVLVAVQREECECINEHELLTPKCLEGCKKRKKGQRAQKETGTHMLGMG
jgi:hypothetical protein